MVSGLDTFYLGKEEPNRGCLLALRNLILKKNSVITETRKYGMPCFCYGKKAFCYLWTDKNTNEPYLLFVDGKLIDHPDLESGTRSRMKIYRVNPTEDLQINTINDLLDLALALYSK